VLKRSPALLGESGRAEGSAEDQWGCSIRGDVGLLLAPSFLRRRSISQQKGWSIGRIKLIGNSGFDALHGHRGSPSRDRDPDDAHARAPRGVLIEGHRPTDRIDGKILMTPRPTFSARLTRHSCRQARARGLTAATIRRGVSLRAGTGPAHAARARDDCVVGPSGPGSAARDVLKSGPVPAVISGGCSIIIRSEAVGTVDAFPITSRNERDCRRRRRKARIA
jgi:hypothetical protein